MPIDIGGGLGFEPTVGSFLGGYGALSRMAQRHYDPARAWRDLSPHRGGSVGGGLSRDHLYDLLYNPQKYSVLSPSREVTSPILQGKGKRPRTGAFTLDMIDWNSNLAQLSGSTLGLTEPLIGRDSVAARTGGVAGVQLPDVLRDPMQFLADKDIDLFRNAPARLFDYAFSPINLGLKGLGVHVPSGEADDEPGVFPFQKEPTYWIWLRESTEEDRAQMASYQADRSIDRSRNAYLRDELTATFERDFQSLDGLSSGNERFDYLAKRTFEASTQVDTRALPGETAAQTYQRVREAIDVASRSPSQSMIGPFLAMNLPLVGTQLGRGIEPISPQTEQAWRSLAPEERIDYLTNAGYMAAFGDILATLPLFSGVGAVAGLARAGGFASIASRFGAGAEAAARIGRAGELGVRLFDRTIKVTNGLMATGLTVATANWAASAASPQWSDSIGREIDSSRIVSGSQLAGVVNATGFLTGFYGVETAVPSTLRALRGKGYARQVAEGIGLVRPTAMHPFGGLPDLSFHREMGGSSLGRVLERDYDLDRNLQGTALSSEFLSINLNHRGRQLAEALPKVQRGGQTGWPDIDSLPTVELRVAALEEELAGQVRNLHGSMAELLPRLMNSRLADAAGGPAGRAANARRMKLARNLDDEVTQAMLVRYGERFWPSRLTGPGNLRESAQRALRGLGRSDDLAALERWAGTDMTRWKQVNRRLHQILFHERNAELHTAAEGSEEATRIGMVSQRHLFADEVDDLVEELTDADPEIGQAAYRRLIATKDDVQDLEAQGAFTSPETLAEVLQQISGTLPTRRLLSATSADGLLNDFQQMLDAEGLWTVAFKPSGRLGVLEEEAEELGEAAVEEFLSYVKLADGIVFRSPWLDYPMGMPDLIEMGNRGVAMRKLDSVFRGWRTYRLAESQRATLHRRLTALDVGITPARIDRLVEELEELSSKHSVPPQALVVARPLIPGQRGMALDVEHAVERALGKGPYLHADGSVADISWHRELGLSYTTALKLNVTAGLTSRFYGMTGEAGAAGAFISHIVYPAFRFGLSALFKAGEHVESWVLNALRGVNPWHGDPVTESLFLQAGVLHQRSQIRQELTTEPMLQGMTRYTPVDETTMTTRDLLFRVNVPLETTLAKRQAMERGEAARVASIDDFTPDTALDDVYPAAYSDEARQSLGGRDETGAPILDADGVSIDDVVVGRRQTDWIDAHLPIAPTEAELASFELVRAQALARGADVVPRLTRAITPAYGLGSIDELEAAVRAGSAPDALDVVVGPWASGPVAVALRDRVWREAVVRADGQLLTSQGAYRLLAQRLSHVLHDGSGIDDLAGLELGDLPLELSLPSSSTLGDIETVFLRADDVQRWSDLVATHGEELPALRDIGVVVHDGDAAAAYRTYWMEKAGLADRRFTEPVLQAEFPAPLTMDIAPATFREELQRAASAKMGREEVRAPLVNVWLRGTKTGIEGRRNAQLVVSVLAPDGQPYGALRPNEIADIWKRTALPELHTQRLGLYGDARAMMDAQGYRAVWTPEGGPHGSVVFYDRSPLTEAHLLDGPAGERYHSDSTIDPGRVIPVRFVYNFAPRKADTAFVDLQNGYRWDRSEKGHIGWLAPKERRQYVQVDLPARTGDSALDARRTVDHLIAQLRDGKPARLVVDPDNVTLLRELAQRRLRGELPDDWVLVRDGRALDDSDWQEVLGVPPSARELMPEPPPSSLADIPGSPEHLTAAIGARLKAQSKEAWQAYWNPIPSKERQQDKLIMALVQQWYPDMLRDYMPDAYALMRRTLGIPDAEMATFLLEDRRLLGRWFETGARDDFDALVMHGERYRPAGGRAELDSLYASEDWTDVMEILRLTGRTASDEAFGVHFFAPYRSSFERSINHPLLGVYPASWAYKVAKEWWRFLYDNEMIGLRLGMTPAVAIRHLQESQQVAFAQMSDSDLETWQQDGPLSSSIFLFNLLMPGDWSALPFPLSRSIRDALRGNFSPFEHFQNNIAAMGLGRDIRMVGELGAEWKALLLDEVQPLRRTEQKASFDTVFRK